MLDNIADEMILDQEDDFQEDDADEEYQPTWNRGITDDEACVDEDEDAEPAPYKERERVEKVVQPDSSHHYVDNEMMEQRIAEYNRTGVFTNELAMDISNIATRMSYMPCFINYTWRQDMVGEAIVKMVRAIRKKTYVKGKGKAFSYFSQIAYWAFKYYLKEAKNERLALQHYQETMYDQLREEFKDMGEHDEND